MAKRAIVIGIDGMMSYFTRKYALEGKTPAIARLIRNGVIADALPTPPCNTPTNWTTIATGAPTGVHGATGFYCHIPGESFVYGLHERGRTFCSDMCTAEYLWDAADRAGKRCAIVNYLAGWPPKFKRGIMTSGWSFLPERLAGRRWYSLENGGIKLQPAKGWRNAPRSRKPLLEASMSFEDIGAKGGVNLLISARGSKYDTLHICVKGKDARRAVALREGERTPWLFLDLTDGKGRAAFRLRATELEPEEELVTVARSTVYNLKGWTYPESLAEELFTAIDLEAETSGEMADICRLGVVDLTSQRTEAPVSAGLLQKWGVKPDEPIFNRLDSSIVEADRLVKAIRYLLEKYGWELCMLHYHLLDGINHLLCGLLHPEHPKSTPKTRKEAERGYELAYKVVDWFIGNLVEAVADKDTLVVIVSDHAALPCWKFVSIQKAMVRAGLLAYKWDEKKGKHVIDLKRSRAIPFSEPPYVWVNLKGRERGGIVSARDYERVREQIIETLYSIRDPENGLRPVELALRKEHAVFLCGEGERVGDVVYFLRPPYQLWDGSLDDFHHDEVAPERWAEPEVRPARKVMGNHDCYLPTGTLGVFSVGSVLIMSGAGVKRGVEFSERVGLVDVAPTVAHLLGIPAPANCTGSVLYKALA